MAADNSPPRPFLEGVDAEFDLDHAEQILREAPVKYAEKIISVPPIRPQGGEVFLYRANARQEREKKDFRYDQYRWISKGSNNHSGRRRKRVMKRYYYIKDQNGQDKDTLLGFKRSVYNLNDEKDHDIYLIHYIGDASLAKGAPHGNSKSCTKVFLPTRKSVQTEITLKDTFLKKPAELHKHLHEGNCSNGPAGSVTVSCPRNYKQVDNKLQKARSGNQLTNDEIFSLYELALQTGAIKKITIWPNLVVYIALEGSIKLAQDVIRLSRQDKSLGQLLSYDTTFHLGDFFVSPLVMRNVLLEGDPWFPVMFLIHERMFHQDHEEFLTEAFNLLVDGGKTFPNVPIVTDREKGITRLFWQKFPGLTNILCRNQILKDVETWIKKHGGKRDDVKVLKDHIELLLDSVSEEDFQRIWDDVHVYWSQDFLAYVKSSLKDDIERHACRYITSRFPAFQRSKTMTDNISESFNRIFKDEAGWTELPVDTVALLLYYLQTYYIYAFQRASCGLGNHSLKEVFTDKPHPIKYTDLPRFSSLEDVVASIKEKHEVPPEIRRSATARMTQKQLAKLCVKNGQIGFCSENSTFTVLNIDGKGINTVSHFAKPVTCTCPSTGLCCHILAVRMTVGDETM